MLGMCAYRLVEDIQALRALTQFRQRFPRDPRIAAVLLHAGLAAARLDRADEALEAFAAAAEAGKGTPLARSALGEKADLLARRGRHLESLAAYDQLWTLESPQARPALQRKINAVIAAMPADQLARAIAGRYRFPIDEARYRLSALERGTAGGVSARRRDGPPLPLRRVGVILPLRGTWAGYGAEARRGFDLCLEDPGRELPFRLETVFREESSGPGAAETVAELVEREEVIALLGPLLSGNAKKLLPEAGRRSLAVISPTASAAQIEGTSPVFFRTCLTLEAFGAALADFVIARFGRLRFACLVPDEAYARSFAEVVRRSLEARGSRVVSRDYPSDLRTFTALIGDLKEEMALAGSAPETDRAVEALFLAGSAKDAALILAQFAAQDPEARHLTVVGGSGLNTPDFPRLAGRYAEGVLLADGFFAGSARLEAWGFTERYRQRYGADPGTAAAQACAAAEVLTEALRQGASTREEVLRRLGEIGEVSTVLGPIRLFPGGRVERRPFFVTVSGGRLVEIGGEGATGSGSPR